MADPTQTTQLAEWGLPPFPQVLSGDELYDALMSKIEPDLMKAVLPTLDEKYKGETAEQKATREARYAKAVEEYNRRFDAYALAWQSDLKTTQGGVLTTLETIDRDDESQTLAAFESTISQA